MLPGCLSAATLSHYTSVETAPVAGPHGTHPLRDTYHNYPPTSYSSPLATAIIQPKWLGLIHYFGGGKLAACNDTNCPDLNAVIGPLGTLARKWLQLRLFHFLATVARACNFEGGKCFALPAPRSLKCSLMKAKLYKLSRVQEEREVGGVGEVGGSSGNKQKSGSMCGKWVFLLIWWLCNA